MAPRELVLDIFFRKCCLQVSGKNRKKILVMENDEIY
jgi:hypothetical protein